MQTQKDHVDAHSFLVGRMTAALVTGETSYLEAPAQRAKLGLIIGALLAVLVVAGFLVFGLIVPAHKSAKSLPAPGISVNHTVSSVRVGGIRM